MRRGKRGGTTVFERIRDVNGRSKKYGGIGAVRHSHLRMETGGGGEQAWRQYRRKGGELRFLSGMVLSLLIVILSVRLPIEVTGSQPEFRFKLREGLEHAWHELPPVTEQISVTEIQTARKITKEEEEQPSEVEQTTSIQRVANPEEIASLLPSETIPDIEESTGTQEANSHMEQGNLITRAVETLSKSIKAVESAAFAHGRIRNLWNQRLDVSRVLPYLDEPLIDKDPVITYIYIDYPAEAEAQRIMGRVVLSFVVETDGRAYDIRVERSVHPILDSAAVDGVLSAYFKPGRLNGIPVPARIRLAIRFEFARAAWG